MALLVHSPEISTLPKFFCNPNPRNPISFVTLRNNRMVGSRDRVRVRVSELDQGLNLSGLFSAPVKRGSKPSKEEEDKQNYYVNMGYAIRTLREEFPGIFYKELTFDIYRDDIVFKDPLNTFTWGHLFRSVLLNVRGWVFIPLSVLLPKKKRMKAKRTIRRVCIRSGTRGGERTRKVLRGWDRCSDFVDGSVLDYVLGFSYKDSPSSHCSIFDLSIIVDPSSTETAFIELKSGASLIKVETRQKNSALVVWLDFVGFSRFRGGGLVGFRGGGLAGFHGG
ncbi:hypothetical protein CMV_004542 [Castanea mollissima]|uniref:Uncharacterized protein n=1 Tax=Castanea mollissima TaxID=60419 RepID=A0A8J4RYG5_9ROSI|nr:hypothetical protein CMV_004542 [Castanea mollissima]